MVTVLVILAVLAWLFGGLLLSQATYGVGILAAGCLLAILARIAQAANQHNELKRLLSERPQPPAEDLAATVARALPEDDWICMSCGSVSRTEAFRCARCGTRRP